jgi:hypothetical protein
VEIKKTKEDGTQLNISVSFVDGKFKVRDVSIKSKGKRKFTSIKSSVFDDYTYRKLGMKERQLFIEETILSVCGTDIYNESLEEAWLLIKPEKLEVKGELNNE